ncbi:hypothetical protein Pint_29528 [Pistacia integerrima]|uniref:Uncharacterized protein n=1 Tax=Pistacia integerrima TaxID=434235 RepID=A0ACC0X121_9ROSI|nr:hypothetical protein Pint_29528 [Pistacia integerrima]
MLSSSSGQGYKEFQAEIKLLIRIHHGNLTNLLGNAVILSWEDRLRIAMDAAQAKLADIGMSRNFPTGGNHVSTVVAGIPDFQAILTLSTM